MTDALTDAAWRKTLTRVIEQSPSDTSRTLASVLRDVMDDPSDIAGILDFWGSKMLERTS